MKKANKIFPYALLVISFICSLLLFARFGKYNLDADMSSEFVLAKTLNEAKALISNSWFYSTELRVVSPVPVYQVALLLFSSWHHARLFSIAVLMVLCVAAFLYATKNAGIGEAAIYCAACLILPFSSSAMFLFAWGGFYTVYFILGCIIFGLVLSPKSKNIILHFVLISILSLWAGLAGVRMFMILGVPLFLCFGFLFLKYLLDNGNKDLMESDEKKWFIRAIISFLFMAIGYVINVKILSKLYEFNQYDKVITESFTLNELFKRFDALITFFGYHEGVVLLSLEGIVSYLLVFFVVALFVCAFLLIPSHTDIKNRSRAIPLFGLCGFLSVTILDCVADWFSASPNSVGYYFMAMAFLLLCPFIVISRMEHLPIVLRRIGMGALVLFFLADSFSYIRADAKSGEGARARAAHWLVDNGYSQGYSTFWNGNILTELTDGKLEMTTFSLWNSRKPYKWLQKRSHLTEVPQGPVFVYVDEEELSFSEVPCAIDEHLIYNQEGIRIYRYEDAHEVLERQDIQWEMRDGQ